MVWLINYTHYTIDIDSELSKIRSDYLKIKRFKRQKVIGECAPSGWRTYALGLLRIATILHRNGIEIRYMDAEELFSLLDSGFCDFPETVAFSCVCPTAPRCADAAERIRKVSPKTRLILGGIHVNLCPDETAKRFPVFDIFAVGYELEAAEKIAGKDLVDTGSAYVDYSLLPHSLSEYSVNTMSHSGCPFRCNYCSDGRAPVFCASMDGQIGTLKSLLPQKTQVHFFDSVLGYSAQGAMRVCKAIEQTGHDLTLSCDMRADLLTPELIKALYRAGFHEIRMGIESGDELLLKRNGRTLMPSDLTEKLRAVREYSGMYIALYSIVGLPGTTKQSADMTIELFDRLLCDGYADEIKNTLFVPYPISGVNLAERGVYITTDDWTKYDRQSFPVFHTKELSAQQIWNIYIKTARSINESWLRSCGFSGFDDIPPINSGYGEYMEQMYKLKAGKVK